MFYLDNIYLIYTFDCADRLYKYIYIYIKFVCMHSCVCVRAHDFCTTINLHYIINNDENLILI